MRRILILGGTAEARQLARRLAVRADVAVTISLAGRTKQPAAHAVPVRVGGFGGARGLADEIVKAHVDILVDATHPYAAAISRNAAEAAGMSGVPLLMLKRPPWTAVAGDRWTEVADVAAAVEALGNAPQRVFLALGRKELARFATAPQHFFLIRSVDPVDPPLDVPDAVYITGRGPFDEADDRALLTTHGIEIAVAKNSGGPSTYGKIAAARALAIKVIMLQRPALPTASATAVVDTVPEAIAWLDHALAH
jgi:precorrin-6A/cobalt-precorrin-6A reductase